MILWTDFVTPSFLVLSSAASKTHHHAVYQDTLYDKNSAAASSPTAISSTDLRNGLSAGPYWQLLTCWSCKVIYDVHPQESEGRNSFHTVTVYQQWGWTFSLPLPVHHHLFRFTGVSQGGSLEMTLLTLLCCLQITRCVHHTNRKGLSTQPCRKPMLSDRVDDIWDPTHSICGWSVKKLKFQSQIWVEKSRSVSWQKQLQHDSSQEAAWSTGQYRSIYSLD